MYLKFWNNEVEDINKVKRIKMHKLIHEVLNVKICEKKSLLVVYEDGSCESLESAMESRTREKSSSNREKPKFSIEKVQFTDGILSFVKREGQNRFLNFCSIEQSNLKSQMEKSIKIERPGANVRLMDLTVVPGKNNHPPKLLTFWSDRRLFDETLDTSSSFHTVGSVHSILSNIDTTKSLGIQTVSENCIALYSSKDDGASVALYNLKYKIVQSRVVFKVFFFNFKLWVIKSNIYLAMGEQLSMIPFRIGKDKLSDMIGSQRDSEVQSFVEREMLDEDPVFVNGLTFDEDQDDIEGMEMNLNVSDVIKSFKFKPSHGKFIASVEEASENFNDLRSKELYVDVLRDEEQSLDDTSIKCFSNVDEKYPIMSENFEIICQEYEKFGCSEIEITDKIIPVLIAAKRTSDIGLMLKRYNHISEEMLVKILQYLLSCDEEEEMQIEESKTVNGDDVEFDERMICREKKFVSTNVLLSTKQSEKRDVLCIALTCSFSSKTIFRYLQHGMDLVETVKLMNCLHKFIKCDIFDEYDFRGNLVEGEDFDIDQKLFEWFTLLIDSHYQQILLSRNKRLLSMLESWLELVKSHSQILNEMMELRPIVLRLSKKKITKQKKSCSRWYKITRLPLY